MTHFVTINFSEAGVAPERASEVFAKLRDDKFSPWVRRPPRNSGHAKTRATPRGVLTELRGLIERQEKAADTALQIIEDSAPPEIEIGYPVDDREAQARGWPCVGAWRGMAARVVAAVDAPVLLVPAGAAVGTASATDEAKRRAFVDLIDASTPPMPR